MERPAPSKLLSIIGASAAVLVANLYYAQPLISTISRDLELAPRFAGGVVSAGQIGYGVGLLLIVPLSDMVENRRLVLLSVAAALAGIVGVALSHSAVAFLAFALVTGVSASAAQILIPYLSHLLPPPRRGRVLGNVMAGILFSVMLARPFALFVTAAFGWRAVFWSSAAALTALGAALWRWMPPRHPLGAVSYGRTIRTMGTLFSRAPRVRRRTFCQAVLFGCFTMFWAVVPILLAERFALGPGAIGLFALVGAGGALAAPLAGRLADRGATRIASAAAGLLVSASFLLALWSVTAGMLLGLVSAALVLDACVQAAQTFNRLVVLDSPSEVRGRINALYMTVVYFSGAVGSVVGVSLYFRSGWTAVAMVGAAAALVASVTGLGEATAPASEV